MGKTLDTTEGEEPVVTAEQTSCCQKVFTSDVKSEICHIFQLGWPTVLANIFQLLLNTQSVIFCGHLGQTELAAGSLSNTIFLVFGLTAAIGLTSALDTLCAQAFGARNFRMVGVVLQRGICILSIAMVIVSALWMLTQHFLLLIGMGRELSKMSDTFMMILIPILPACFSVQLLIKYLQTQGIVHPIVVVGLITNVVALGLNFLIVKGLNQGFEGIAIALVFANYVQLALLIMYIIVRRIYKKTWKGWSVECLYDWKEFVGLSIPGMMMMCLEWLTFEIGSFLMGTFGENTVAANGVLLQLTHLAFMVPFGISIAASILVGNYLGANDPMKAKLVTKLSLLMTLSCTLVVVITLLAAKKYIAMAFSENENVIELITSTVPFMAFFAFLDSIQGVCSGVIRGCGRQKLGMVLNFISHDIIAIPLAVILIFTVDLRLVGMWIGISTGLFLQSSSFVILIACTNWKRQAGLAVQRTSRQCGVKSPILSRDDVLLEHLQNPDEQCMNKQESSDASLLNKPTTDHLSNPSVISNSASNDDLEALHLSNHDVKFSEPGSTAKRQVVNMKKLIFLRSIPYIIALLLLCSTICIRLFVPLPVDHGSYGNNTIISNLTDMTNRTLPGS